MEAIILIGVQGAGKSTFYRERFADTHVRINLDMLRSRNREAILLKACLEAGQPFVVDNTNATAEGRARYIGPARAAGFRVVAYYFDVPLGEAMRRNKLREGKKRVPPAAVGATFKRLERPRKEEGFDEILVVRVVGDEFVVAEDRSERKG